MATSTCSSNRGWREFHSLQLSFQRRFQNGVSFGFNDTIGLSDRQQTALRLQHSADGSYSVRDDQADADELLGNNNPLRAFPPGQLHLGHARRAEHPAGMEGARLSRE